MRFAVISDVHGNVLALDAVLADIARQGVDATLCLGDHLSGPIDPVATADRLMALDGPIIRGNHDRWLVHPDDSGLSRVDRHVKALMSPAHRAWIEAQPATAVFNGEVFLCHGTPSSDDAPWLDGWFDGRTTTLPSEADVTAAAAGIDFPVMLCGHTHAARSVRLADGRLIINPGSVGMQVIHGSPDARYAIVERRDGKWFTDFRIVPYDHDAAAQMAAAAGFPHWHKALTTGWVPAQGLF